MERQGFSKKLKTICSQVIGVFLVVFILGYITGCGSKEQAKKQVTIFAASSLTDVMQDVKKAYEEKHSDVELVINLAGTKTLTNQLENGAEADIFLSASEKYCKQVDEQGMVEKSQAYVNNRMVLVVPAENSKGITAMSDLQQEHHLILAEELVPAGNYARQVLRNHNKLYGEGYADKVLTNLVSSEPNVRQVMTKMVLGEGDAALVYATDVTSQVKDKVKVIEITPEHNVIGHCWIALLKGSEVKEEVVDCYEFLVNESKEICETYGFGMTVEP